MTQIIVKNKKKEENLVLSIACHVVFIELRNSLSGKRVE